MSQPIRLWMRADLVSSRQAGRRGPVWVIKDPIASRYFRLEEEEYQILRSLDGQTSIVELRQRFQARFSRAVLDSRRLMILLSSFHRAGLVYSDHPRQADQLYEQSRERVARQRWQSWTNVLAIRFRGVNPQSFLDAFYPWCRWMYSSGALLIGAAVVVLAIIISVSGWSDIAPRIPQFHEMVSVSNLMWILLILPITKLLHELGHALTCKHFGGECNELGLMLLVFTPCLYCNVTDSWMLANQRHRIAISAAGICVDVFLASLATLLWWATSPGLIHRLAGNVILICGIGSIFINGNPLLRYDGYHILSDRWDLPNLWQQSRERLSSVLRNIILGGSNDETHSSDRKNTLLVYGILSVAYKALVLVMIFAAIHGTMRRYGYQIIAEAFIIGTALTLVMGPSIRFAKYISRPTIRTDQRRRMVAVLTLFSAGLAALVLIPFPRNVRCLAVVEAGDEQRVYVAVAGSIVDCAAEGQFVERGDVLARLEDPQLQRRHSELTGEIELYRLRLRNLQAQRGRDPRLAAAIPTVRKMLAETEQQLTDVDGEIDRLTIQSPRRGIVLPGEPLPQSEDPLRLLIPTCRPLQPANRGCFVTTGTELCSIGDPEVVDVLLLVAEEDAAAVEIGQAARVRLDIYPHATCSGSVTHIESHQRSARLGEEKYFPPAWADKDAGWYRARVRLDGQDELPLIHGRGRARIRVASEPLAARAWRFLRRNF